MPLANLPYHDLTGPLVRGVGEGGVLSSFKGFFTTNSLMSDVVVPYGTATINEKSATGATVSVSVDPSVTFFGRASTKATITGAGSSTTLEVGVSSAAINLNAGAQDLFNRHLLIAVKTDGANTINNVLLYLGDGSYTNFRNISTGNSDNVSGWTVFEALKSAATSTTGTPIALSLPQRAKVRFTTTANVSAGNVWISPCVAVPRPRPTVVFTCDDGYAEWDWLSQQAKLRNIPVSFGIDADLVGGGGYLTSAQIQSIASDPSGLFEFTTHGRSNRSFSSEGLAAYMADQQYCRDYLIGLGLDPYAARLHQYVQGSFDQTLIDALKADGFNSCRQVGSSLGQSSQNALIAMGADDALYNINVACSLDVAQTLTTVKANLTSAATAGTAFIMGHKFQPTAGTLTWVNGYDANNGVLDLLDWLASQRDTQGWQILKWSDWSKRVRNGAPVV